MMETIMPDYQVNGIPVQNRWVQLKRETRLFRCHTERGAPQEGKVFLEGTWAHYTTCPYNGEYVADVDIDDGRITHWVHTLTIAEGDILYVNNKRIEWHAPEIGVPDESVCSETTSGKTIDPCGVRARLDRISRLFQKQINEEWENRPSLLRLKEL
jgi:hypothetical protein